MFVAFYFLLFLLLYINSLEFSFLCFIISFFLGTVTQEASSFYIFYSSFGTPGQESLPRALFLPPATDRRLARYPLIYTQDETFPADILPTCLEGMGMSSQMNSEVTNQMGPSKMPPP